MGWPFTRFTMSCGQGADIQDDADTALWNQAWIVAMKGMAQRAQLDQSQAPERRGEIHPSTLMLARANLPLFKD